MSATIISVTRVGEKLAVQPTGYLAGSFNDYLGAVRTVGARFDAKEKRHLVDPQKLDQLYTALVRAGFNVENTQAVVEMLQERARSATKDAGGVSARAEGKGLFPYQISGATWLSMRDRGLLADDMGLGKTVQALIALPENAAVVVVCPAAVKGVWQRECTRWRPDLSTTILKGRKSWRWPNAGEVVIINYDILPDAFGVARPIVLVADEAHGLKNYKAKRTERFTALSKALQKCGGRTWLLTGTPLLGRPFDLWGVLGAASLGFDAYGSWAGFIRAFNGEKNPEGGYTFGDPGPEAAEGLARVCLRRRKAEVLPQLPKKSYQDIFVEIDPEGGGIDAMRAWLEERQMDGDRPWTEDEANKIPFELISRVRHEIACAKIPAMIEVVEEYEEAEEPLVVFSAHVKPVMALDGRYGWATITGETKPEERSAIVADFQAGRLRGVALTIAAGGVGLTLTRASHLLMVDLEWTPALNVQAEDRVCRIGQNRAVLIKRLVCDSKIDRRLHEVIAKKVALITATVERATTTDVTAVPKTMIESALDVAKKSIGNTPIPARAPAKTIEIGALPAGMYALEKEGGGVSFWQLDRPDAGNLKGFAFLKVQVGPSVNRYGMVRPDKTVVGEQGTFAVLTAILADPEAASRRYGRELGMCGVCGRPLTNAASRAAGIGPICAEKNGWSHDGAGFPHDDAQGVE